MVSLTNFRSVNELSSSANLVDGFDPQPNGKKSSKYQLNQLDASSLRGSQNGKHFKNLKAQAEKPLANLKGSQGGEHFEIRWSNLTYQVEPKWYRQSWRSMISPSSSQASGKTTILNSLNGSVRSGQVTAILGPSGAGKTSLLGCLTGKHRSGVSGSVEILSERLEPMSICTIPQKDFLLNQLTVRENLWFASRLKHPERDFDHDSNIERVLDLLKLESCIDTKISKISGGQYKRVSIAQELLSNPDIMILDEPTSGLDSLTCYKTVMVLRDLARLSPNPMAIIVTIHQPQREVFDLFNHVYILAVGGRCIYEGQPALSIKTINECSAGLHFEADQYNPASYLVEIASAEFGQKPIEALVENQAREFRHRCQQADEAQAAALLAAQQRLQVSGVANYGGASYGQLAATPASSRRPKQSPMVARFKCTLSSLRPGSAHSARSSQSARRPAEGHAYAYTNEAFTRGAAGEPFGELPADQFGAAAAAEQQRSLPAYSPLPPPDHRRVGGQARGSNGHSQAPSSELRADSASLAPSAANDHLYLDQRLQTHKHNHQGHFLRHCQLLTKRSWLCLCKDPMLTTLRFSAHIIVPLLITLVYGSGVGKPNACPLYETEMDLIDYAQHGAKRLLVLQSELRCTFENVGLYFLSIYAFTFSTMCLTSLSFPLSMHVLLKEVRNGWYSIPTFFIGKTLADFPLEFILPVLTLMITYPFTGQPSSYLEWRFLLATFIFVITSLIAQTQGLIFGALFMNAMQAAVFVAPVSTTPLILLSGFLIRISQMPIYLQQLSSLSYFRYAIESLTIIRYGFGVCPCDPKLVNGQPVTPVGVPDQLRTMTNYWLSTFDSPANAPRTEASTNETDLALAATPTLATTTQTPVDFFQDLTELLARANSFGVEIRTCQDYKPYPMIDFSLDDQRLWYWVTALVVTLFVFKIINYLVVKYSVKLRL